MPDQAKLKLGSFCHIYTFILSATAPAAGLSASAYRQRLSASASASSACGSRLPARADAWRPIRPCRRTWPSSCTAWLPRCRACAPDRPSSLRPRARAEPRRSARLSDRSKFALALRALAASQLRSPTFETSRRREVLYAGLRRTQISELIKRGEGRPTVLGSANTRFGLA
jgi:hypothetical protein